MDFFDEGGRGRDGAGGGDDRIVNAARAQTLRYSNFLLTISTNVRPRDEEERDALVEWLLNHLGELFGDFDLMNGNVLKPPGTANGDMARFPADNKIIKITNRIAVEQGDYQQGQIHAHVLLEVAHQYVTQEHGAEGTGNDTNRPHLGVHINVAALRNWLNDRIPDMNVAGDRRPPKIYVNSRLLTKGTDNSNKFLTLQYLNKDRAKDNGGGTRNLVGDARAADPTLTHIRDVLREGAEGIGHDPENIVVRRSESPENWRDDDRVGLGGALSAGNSPVQVRRPRFEPQASRPRARPIPPQFVAQNPAAAAPKFVRTTTNQKGPRKF
jgi:hypothetical protein